MVHQVCTTALLIHHSQTLSSVKVWQCTGHAAAAAIACVCMCRLGLLSVHGAPSEDGAPRVHYGCWPVSYFGCSCKLKLDLVLLLIAVRANLAERELHSYAYVVILHAHQAVTYASLIELHCELLHRRNTYVRKYSTCVAYKDNDQVLLLCW
jgi:hypothetical protein